MTNGGMNPGASEPLLQLRVGLGPQPHRTAGRLIYQAANLRLGWTYRPGADVFLVLNQRWDAPTLGLRTVRDRKAILKLTYLIAV